jgi:hypothetical protein
MNTPFTVITAQPDLPAKPKAWWQRLIVGAVLACTLLVQSSQVLAQYQNYGQNNTPNYGQPSTGYIAPAISAPVSASFNTPFSGYNPDGTLYMGGQRIGNPHQVLHDAQIPAFMTITANRYTYSADSTHGQGTLAQMELATTSGSTSSVLLNRLYLSPNNPYATTQPLGQVWPYPNYQTYQGVLLNSQQAGYLGTTAQDGKDYLFKTLTAASSQAFTILIKELPNTPQFRAASDPAGGGVGVRVEQNGDAAALANYYKTVQPYDFTWRPNAGLYTGAGNGSGQNAQLDPMYSGWANSPGGAYSGANYAEGGGAPQSFNDFIKQQQAEALANDKRVRSQTTANSLDLSNTNVNTLFGEGYNLFDYGNKTNPNLAAENEYLRKLQNGEFNAGSADYTEASRIAQERYRIAYATRLETNKPLQYSVADSQRKANELNLVDTNPNKLFGDGYDLFNYDPLTNPNGAAENALLTRLQNGQLTPGTTEYEEAKSIAQQRYRNAYSNSLAFNIAPKFSVAEAQRKANEIDLSQVNPNELFGQGFDLFQYNPALRPNGEAENDLMAKLQNGELTVGSPEYLEATQIAQQRLRDAYSISLVPPEPKKKTWWKEIVILVVAAIAVYFTAGAASAWLGELAASSAASTASAGAAAAGAGAAGQAAAAGAAYASTLTAAASSSTLLGAAIAGGSAMAGSYAGAVIGTGLSTGSLSQGLRAGEIALTRGSIQTLATVIVLGGLGLTGLDDVLGSTGTSIVSNSIGSAAATSYLSGGSFGDALLDASLQNIVNIASAGAAKEIGTQFPNLDGTNLLNYAAHAGLGCASASATGGNCAAGAAGAAAGEAAAATGLLNFAAAGFGQTLTDGGTVFFGGLVGGTVASAVGSNDSINANFATGQATAQNAVTNNYLTHRQIKEKEDRLATVKDEADRQAIRDEYEQLDIKQRDSAAACLLQNKCESIYSKQWLKTTLDDLYASCAMPRICSADQTNSINELRDMYLKRQAIQPDTTIEEFALMFGKVPKAVLSAAESVLTRETIAAVRIDASSSLQGARLNMQLSAEQAAGSRAPTVISSYSDHAMSRMATRDGVGVSQTAVADAFKNPIKIEYHPTQYGPTFRYIGKDATVNVNPQGNVTTLWARNSGGYK